MINPNAPEVSAEPFQRVVKIRRDDAGQWRLHQRLLGDPGNRADHLPDWPADQPRGGTLRASANILNIRVRVKWNLHASVKNNRSLFGLALLSYGHVLRVLLL